MISSLQLTSLTEDEKEILKKFVSEKTLAKNEMLFRENDLGDAVYVVKDGLIKISKKMSDPQSSDETLALLKQGEVFGEMGLLCSRPRYAHAISLADTTLEFIDRLHFTELKVQHPKVALKLMEFFIELLGQKLRQMTDRLYGIF